MKIGNNAIVANAAVSAVEQLFLQSDVDNWIRRLEPTALIQITKAVRDKIAGINIRETSKTRHGQPIWDTSALINKICAVQQVKIYNQDTDQWSNASIGTTPRGEINSIDHLLRINNSMPNGKGTQQYGREFAIPEHISTAYFCIGKAAANRNPVTKNNAGTDIQPDTPHAQEQLTTQLTPTLTPPDEEEEINDNMFCNYTPLHQHTPQVHLVTCSYLGTNAD